MYINPSKPEFTIVIFIHYKPRIAAAILVVDKDDLTWVNIFRKLPCFGKSFIYIFILKPLGFTKIKSVFQVCKMIL